MANDHFNITRRRVLGTLGIVGGGALLGGAGTSAFFSDTESFENNQLVAGSLDLKVDWQESYNGELIDAYPDYESDGVQDGPYSLATVTHNPGLVGLTGNATQEEIRQGYRDQFAQVPAAFAGRRPLLDLQDVKPGDSGEVTFSMHLFDNPGYLWLFSTLRHASENGYTEPELADDQEDGPEGGVVELLDAIQATVWYDDGNNSLEDGEVISLSPTEMATVSGDDRIIADGSLRDVLLALSPENGYPLDADPTTEGRDCYTPSTTKYVGFKWELPVDHANEVQTDSVTFDLGFYTEQCRHNDGQGLPAQRTVTLHEQYAKLTGYETTAATSVAGSGAWASTADTPTDLEFLYLGPAYTTFNQLPTFTVDDIAEISYWTNRGHAVSGDDPADFFVQIYTEPDGTEDDAGWYGYRLTAEPYWIDMQGEPIDAPADEWSQWSTAGIDDVGTNKLLFVDKNRSGVSQGYASSVGSMATLADLQAGPINWVDLVSGAEDRDIDYGAETVKTISLSTGTPWASSFEGYVDAAEIRLTSGERLTVDLEP